MGGHLPVTDAYVLEQLERLAQHLRAELDVHEDDNEQFPELLAKVRAYLAEHPTASANAVWRELGGRRNDVLRAVRRARVPVPSEPEIDQEGSPA
jgi:hypothetical protein